MSNAKLHRTQLSILHSLRYSENEGFNALMHQTDQSSDTFKFHLRKLVHLGYVIKLDNGKYQLTPLGKEYSNNINEALRSIEKQPKISLLMVIANENSKGESTYLLQKRLRNPFFGYWGEIHGRAEWGEPFEATAERQLKRQTGLDADFTVQGFRRVRDFHEENKILLEDKLFVILKATKISGNMTNNYAGGKNAWLTAKELAMQDKFFITTLDIIASVEKGEYFKAQDLIYQLGDY